MNSEALLVLTDRLKIPVKNYKLPNKKAFCAYGAIAIDYSRIETDRECKKILAEEIGHTVKRAMYPLSDCCETLRKTNIDKQEARARKYALTLQVPIFELKQAIDSGLKDIEIAELLDVDLETLAEAVEHYKVKGAI